MAGKYRKKQKLLPGILAICSTAILLGVICFALSRPSEPITESETLPPLQENPYSDADFQLKNGYLTCLAEGSYLGIDISSHQGEVDFQQVADSGFRFVFLRIGYRGYKNGLLNADECFQTNLENAEKAGLHVGVYFFSQAITLAEAQEEADFVLELLGNTKLDLPVAFDWEYIDSMARTGHTDGRALTDIASAFCSVIQKAGYRTAVYFNRDIGKNMYFPEELTDSDFWLAQYDGEMDFPYRVQYWQYTESGAVPGISGNVDIDLYLP